ncbi:hypothetical protein NDU88_005347 [Pleurodeles waltl]|uniref:Uncharacterized protein n=1 Tax=Pleurodeles waltl TaxID=8319 RepID=A0AAV7TA55_PLEWA|nr:hypothetical protein NDU88_005347 [Pleurodeles waltl]
MERWRRSAQGLRDPDFSPERKSRGPQTPLALLAPTSAGVRRVGHPGRAPYESDFTVRPRLSYKLRAADGAHQRDIGEDIRLSAKIIGAQWTTILSSAERGLALHLAPILGRGHIRAWRASTKGQCKLENTFCMNPPPPGRRAAERCDWGPGRKWSRA